VSWLEWSAASLAAGVVAFALVELAVRAALRAAGDYWVLNPYRRLEMQVDRATLPQLEETVRIHINGDGERGDELPTDWSQTYRVLVAGGSAAECFLLDQDSNWPAVVQQRLNSPANLEKLAARHVHVGNVSRSLVACEYIDMIFQRVLPRYERLDLVLFFVGASDVVNWLEKKTPPRIESGQLSTSYVFAEHPEGFGWRLKQLASYRWLARLNQRLRLPIERKQNAGRTIQRNRDMRARARVMLDETPDPTPLIEYFELHFRKLIEHARTRAKRVIVVRQPWLEKDFSDAERAQLWNFGAGRPYEGEVTEYYTHKVVFELMACVDRAAVGVAEELGVETLELKSQLPADLETYYDLLHFTPPGAARVGEIVADAIVAD
jgi:hypothetical protein